MNDREQILTRLRVQQRPGDHPAPFPSLRRFDDLAGRFSESLTAGLGEVHRVDGPAAALDRLGGLLVELDAHKVAANAAPLLDGIDLARRWPGIQWAVAGRDNDSASFRAFCAAADAGISGADAALAETGTVVISSGPGRSRYAPLLPPVHIALVAASSLTADFFTWTAARGRAMPANVTLVSGPSKSADIEQTLAIGVHGPKRLIVILY